MPEGSHEIKALEQQEPTEADLEKFATGVLEKLLTDWEKSGRPDFERWDPTASMMVSEMLDNESPFLQDQSLLLGAAARALDPISFLTRKLEGVLEFEGFTVSSSLEETPSDLPHKQEKVSGEANVSFALLENNGLSFFSAISKGDEQGNADPGFGLRGESPDMQFHYSLLKQRENYNMEFNMQKAILNLESNLQVSGKKLEGGTMRMNLPEPGITLQSNFGQNGFQSLHAAWENKQGKIRVNSLFNREGLAHFEAKGSLPHGFNIQSDFNKDGLEEAKVSKGFKSVEIDSVFDQSGFLRAGVEIRLQDNILTRIHYENGTARVEWAYNLGDKIGELAGEILHSEETGNSAMVGGKIKLPF